MSSDPQQGEGTAEPVENTRRSGESQLIWIIWLTYGSFYFCRNNLAIALPGIEEDLGYTKSEMANVLLSLKVAYGIGQFISAQRRGRFENVGDV